MNPTLGHVGPRPRPPRGYGDAVPALTLPRSVLAALWLPHVRDLGDVTRAGRAITGDDEPHRAVVGRAQLNLAALFAQWVPVRTVAATLPVPGAPAGTPAAVSADAIDAGECLVVTDARGSWTAVPEVRAFGSALEPGATVTWHVTSVPDVGPALVAAVGSFTDARAGLAQALTTATDLLARMDLARWRPEAADRIADLVSTRDPDWDLPREVGPERLDVLVRAARLLAIVDLATADDGAAVTAWQVGRRAAALRDVQVAARRAMSAATLVHRD